MIKRGILFLFTICLISTNRSFAQKMLPDVILTNLKGNSVSILDEIDLNKVTIVNFWATWCIPCINELEAINDIYEDWQEDLNIELIAVSTDDSRTQKRVRPLVNGKDWPYKILFDKNHDLKRSLNIPSVPYTIIVFENKILFRKSGYTPGSEYELYEFIEQLTTE
jgi:thiol-disulfide isomerase/thioredoxin